MGRILYGSKDGFSRESCYYFTPHQRKRDTHCIDEDHIKPLPKLKCKHSEVEPAGRYEDGMAYECKKCRTRMRPVKWEPEE